MDSSGSDEPLISILLPTRGRPAMAGAFLNSLVETAVDRDRIEVVLYVDEDDPARARLRHKSLKLITIVGSPVTMGAANSTCLAQSSGDPGQRRCVAQTSGWDAQMRQAHERFADGVYLVWLNDGLASHRMSTFPVLSRRCCEILGDPYPLVYRSAFIDYALFDIFVRLRRLGHDRLLYLSNVLFEHRHHRRKKREADDTTKRHRRFEDDMTFLERRDFRQQQAERLAAAIAGVPVPPFVAGRAARPNSELTIPLMAKGFLFDRGLPMTRRLYLFGWYCGRYLAAKLTRA